MLPVEFTELPIDDTGAHFLRLVDAVSHVPDTLRLVEEGRAKHIAACQAGERVGAMAIAGLKDDFGFDICASGAGFSSLGLIGASADWLALQAAENGCDGVRFYTKRPGMVRRLTRLGFTPEYWMLRKSV